MASGKKPLISPTDLYFRLTFDTIDLSSKNSVIKTAGYSNYLQNSLNT
jgi:hypothetical protein